MSPFANQFLHKICIIFLVLKHSTRVIGDLNIPCYFIFGDSLVDVGNNNGLNTGAKANYFPYGIDFPQGPTGRFSNGLVVVDYIAKYIGFKDFIPPYATVKRKEILTGVNYASAGSGILDESGDNLGEHFSFNKQILHHKKVISQIKTLQGNGTYTQDYLKKCLYTIHIGNNDYINNYFAPKNIHKRHNVSADQFATTLVNQFSKKLNWLYILGARKFSISWFRQIGCAPAETRLFGTTNACVKEINDALNVFTIKQLTLLADLNNRLADAKIVVPDLYVPSSLPLFTGILVVNTPCCRVSDKLITRGQCLPTNVTCSGRGRYLFFDGFHPTESGSIFYSRRMMLAISQLF